MGIVQESTKLHPKKKPPGVVLILIELPFLCRSIPFFSSLLSFLEIGRFGTAFEETHRLSWWYSLVWHSASFILLSFFSISSISSSSFSLTSSKLFDSLPGFFIYIALLPAYY